MKATLIYLHSVIIQAWLHIMLTSFCMQHFLLGLVKTVSSYWDTQVGVFNSYSLNIHVFPAVLFFVKFAHFDNSCVQQILYVVCG